MNCSKKCSIIKYNELMKRTINKLFSYYDNQCNYCLHYIPCLGEKCDCYIDGVGMEDNDGSYLPWKWSCMDFDFGECDKLKGTSCEKCTIDNDCFEWNGKEVE